MKEKRKLDRTNKIGIAIVSLLIILALTSIILHFVLFEFSFVSIINAFIICVITTILCVIFGGATSGKHQRKKEKSNGYEYVKEPITAKKFFMGLGVLLACGIGYIPLFIFGSININKINSPSYVKTEAVIANVTDTSTDVMNPTSSPKYVYKDLDGNKHVSQSNATWGGITFKLGEKVTIYYSVDNPEITLNLSDSVMMIVGACFFLFGGLLAFLSCIERTQFIPALFGLIFMLFSGGLLTAAKLASGMSFFTLFASGAMAYAMFLFFAMGLFFFLFGVVNIVKFIRYNIHEREFNSEIQQLLKEEKKSKKLEKSKQSLVLADSKEVSNYKKKKYKYKFTWQDFKSLFGIIFGGTVFFVVGLCVMIFVGIVPLAKAASYTKTEATVTEIHTYHDKEGNLLAYFDYEYFVDGKKYEKESSYGQSAEIAPSVGDKVTIYYNPNNPDELTDSSWTDWITTVVGFIFACVGAGLIIVPIILTSRVEIKDKTDDNPFSNGVKSEKNRKKNITRVGGKEI